MNGYGRLTEIQRDIAGVTSAQLVPELVALRDEVSREFDRRTGRQFYSTTETRVFDGDGCASLYVGDLISVTTLKFDDDGDGTYEITLSASDYWLWPANRPTGYAARRIDLNPNGSYPSLPSGRQKVQIVGKWGHSEITEAVIVGSSQITGTLSSDSDLTLATSAAPTNGEIAPGDVLVMGTEQMGPVLDVSGTTVTLQARGINGTTAAGHSGVAIYLRRYPSDVENAVKERTVGRRWDVQGGHQSVATMLGDVSGAAGSTQARASYSRWLQATRDYTNPAAVI